MNIYPVQLVAPKNMQQKIISATKNGLRVALRNRFVERIPNIDKHKVQAFFERRSIQNRFPEFTESTSDWYMSLLDKSEIITDVIQSNNQVKICDIGCGRGGLIEWLIKKNLTYSYTGFDIDRVAVVKCERKYENPNTRFFTQDTENINPDVIGMQDLIFTINVLPYVENLEFFIDSIKQIITPQKSYLAIIDPTPSYYWDNAFGGFVIKLRKPKQLIAEMESFGFELQEFIQLKGLEFLTVPLIGISSLTIWKLK